MFGKMSLVGFKVNPKLTGIVAPWASGAGNAEPYPSTESTRTVALHGAFEHGDEVSAPLLAEMIATTVPAIRQWSGGIETRLIRIPLPVSALTVVERMTSLSV